MPDAIDFLAELIARARDGEQAVQAAVAARLKAMRSAVEEMRYDPAQVRLREEFATGQAIVAGERVAVLARLAGTGGGRSLILFAHPDSEPVPSEHGWSADPFVARLDDGRIHGWGVADDLSGVAAMVSGLEVAMAEGLRPKGDVIIASTPSKRHARGVAAVLERIPPPDAAVYLHPAESGAGMGEIKACTPGLLDFRIEIDGRPPDTQEIGHAAFAHLAANAVAAARAVLSALADLDARRAERLRHARIDAAVGRAANVLVSSVTAGRPDARNRVPVSCVIAGVASFPPGESLDAVMAEMCGTIDGTPMPAGWPEDLKPRVSFPAGVGGAETPAGHPLFQAAEAAIRAETGRAATVNPLHTASDIRVPILQKGIPTVGLGPLGGDLTQNGRTDEWVDAEDHRRCVRVVARLIRDWCG